MNIWFVVILIVTVALIAGPIMMLRPNPAQKKREGWRMQAHQLGLRFMMRALPKQNTDIDSTVPMPVYYLPPKKMQEELPDWMLIRTAYEHEGNMYRDWDWQDAGRPNQQLQQLLKKYLSNLPQGVRAISNGNQGTCIYWDERGSENLVPLLAEILTSLQQGSIISDSDVNSVNG